MTLKTYATLQEILHPENPGRFAAVLGIFLFGLTQSPLAGADTVSDAGIEDSTDDEGDTDSTQADLEDSEADAGDSDSQPADLADSAADTIAEASDSEQPSGTAPSPIVCLSPGHPSTPGDKCYEAVLNRRVAARLKSLLQDAGYGVVVTVDDLTQETLFAPGFDSEDETHWEALEVKTPEEKAAVCNDAGADFVISIHHNYAYNRSINDTLVFYSAAANEDPTGESVKKWAKATARSLGRVMRTEGYRAYSDLERLGFSLSIAANSTAPTILTEAAFYSNPRARRRLNSAAYIEKEAKALFDAFHAHYQKSVRRR